MAVETTEEGSFEGPDKHFTRENLESVVIESDDIPLRGSPEEFLVVVDEMKGSGSRRVGDLEDSIDEFGRTNLSANIKYGENLGFIERTGEGVILTDEGFELAYAQENEEDLSDYFIDGLRSEENYLALLLEFEGETDYQSLIKNSDILQVMYTEHDLREESETVLKRAATILFDTLELAGYGERKEAGGDYPRRFSFADGWTTDSMLAELILDDSGEDGVSEEDEEDEEEDEREVTDSDSDGSGADEVESNTTTEGDEASSNSTDKTTNDDSGHPAVEKDGDSVNDKQIDSGDEGTPQASDKGNRGEDTQNVTINIDLEIDVNEMDSAELGQKVEHINKLIYKSNS